MINHVKEASSEITRLIEKTIQLAQEKKPPKNAVAAFLKQIAALNACIQEMNHSMNAHTFQSLNIQELGKLNNSYHMMANKLISLNSLVAQKKDLLKVNKKLEVDAVFQQTHALLTEVDTNYQKLKAAFKEGMIHEVTVGGAKTEQATVRRIRSAQFGEQIDKIESLRKHSLGNVVEKGSNLLGDAPFVKKKKSYPNLIDISENEIDLSELSLDSLKLKTALDFIDNDAILKTEGLFRISPRQDDFQKVKAGVEHGAGIHEGTDVHLVASLIKDTLRGISFEAEFVNGMTALVQNGLLAGQEKIQRVVELFKKLPVFQQNVLADLLAVLLKVAEKSEFNRMHEDNLGVVMAPNIFSAGNVNNNAELLLSIEQSREAFNLLFETYKQDPQRFSGTGVRFEEQSKGQPRHALVLCKESFARKF